MGYVIAPTGRLKRLLINFFSRLQEIDEYIAKAKDQGYHTVLNLGTKGVNYATTVIMQTAIKVSLHRLNLNRMLV